MTLQSNTEIKSPPYKSFKYICLIKDIQQLKGSHLKIKQIDSK